MKKINEESAFTMIEMLIVIVIISTLLLIAVPNMTKSNEVVNGKSCDVTIKLLQSQVAAYGIEKGTLPPSLDSLVTENYVDTISCPGGETLILSEGKIQLESSASAPSS
jgi:competence protein ComGC